MQGRNATDIHDMLHIDYITNNGSTKYNLTSIKRLTNLMMDNRTLIILVHGFMESSDGLMVSAIAPEFLKMSKLYKVLALDGRNLISLEYFRSSTYARFMGEKLGSLLAAVIKSKCFCVKIYFITNILDTERVWLSVIEFKSVF